MTPSSQILESPANPGRFRPARVSTDGRLWYVHFPQVFNGVRVVAALIGITIDYSGKLIAFGADSHPNINVLTTPSSDALTVAQQLLNTPTIEFQREPKLKIWPQQQEDQFTYTLIWELHVNEQTSLNDRETFRYIIDANSGNLLRSGRSGLGYDKQKGQHHDKDIQKSSNNYQNTSSRADLTGQLTFEHYQEPNDYLGVDGFAGGRVRLGPTSTNANSSGNYILSKIDPGTHTVSFDLATPYAKALTLDTEALRTETVTVTVPTTQDHYWDAPSPLNTDFRANAVFLATEMHDFYKTLNPNYDDWDEQMRIKDHATSPLAGSADGVELTIGSTSAKSSDIVYHEYTHMVIYRIYGDEFIEPDRDERHTEASAMDEGLPDYFASAKNDDPIWGGTDPGIPTRNMNNNFTMSDWYVFSGVNLKHKRGQILNGMLWKLRDNQDLYIAMDEPSDFILDLHSAAFHALSFGVPPRNFRDYCFDLAEYYDYTYGADAKAEIELECAQRGFTTLAANVKIFLDGPFIPSQGIMHTDLVNTTIFPDAQPYDLPEFVGTAMEYNGPEVRRTFTDDIVDWVLVELRTGDPNNPPMTIVGQRAALLREDGQIIGTRSGNSQVSFDGLSAENYYIVVRHRNHLPVMSASPVALDADVSGTAVYDFTTASSQAYGINPMKQEGGIYALWGGDGNGNGSVSAFDYLEEWLPINGQSNIYEGGDFNMDREGTSFDFLDVWLPANGQASQVPEIGGGGSAPAMKMIADQNQSPIKGRLQTRVLDRNKIELSISLKSEQALAMGTSTFWIGYNQNAVSFPLQPNEELDYSFLAFNAGRNPYYSSTVTHPLPGIISVNIALLELDRGSIVRINEFEESLTLQFDILDQDLDPDFAWVRCELSDDRYTTLAGTCSGVSDSVGGDLPSFATTDDRVVSGTFELSDAYPNPFNPQSQFTLAVAQDQQVKIKLYDVMGHQIGVIYDGTMQANKVQRFSIDGSNLASGMYLYRITGETFSQTRKLHLLK